MAAAGFAAASGVGLLATNYEIAYVAMGAWFALIIALWLGFELRCSGRLFYGGLVCPLLIVGLIAMRSAWEGQRSQFGYSKADRSDYVSGATIAADFAYMHSTMLPPEISNSMSDIANWRSTLSSDMKGRIFYGPGLEWLERPWPTLKLPGMPLWMHGGTSYGPRQENILLEALSGKGPYQYVLVPEARDHWDEAIATLISTKYLLHRIGPVWFRYDKLPPEVVSLNPVDFLLTFGGNVNPTQLRSTLDLHKLTDGRTFLGVEHGSGVMKLIAPSHRAAGEAVIRLLPGQSAPPNGSVHFDVFSSVDGNLYQRWKADLKLQDSQSELIVPFPIGLRWFAPTVRGNSSHGVGGESAGGMARNDNIAFHRWS